MGAFIEVRDVEKVYVARAGARQALRRTSLDIAEGEFVSIVGPSGCGKTTLMKIVAGLLPASAGEVRIDGVPVHEPPDGVGIVFQAATLLPLAIGLAANMNTSGVKRPQVTPAAIVGQTCTLPFDAIKQSHAIDTSCPAGGTATSTSYALPQSPPARVQGLLAPYRRHTIDR